MVRVLVLGTSGSSGLGLREKDTAWPLRLAERTEHFLGPIELVNRIYSPNGPGALAFADRLLREHRPEIVITSSASYPFLVADVSHSVRNRFGERAEALFDGAERGFRRVAGASGPAGRASEAIAKRAARRVLGTAGLLSEELATDIWLSTFDRLAREETAAIFTLEPTEPTARFVEEYPTSLATHRRFSTRLKERGAKHHFTWIDVEPAFCALPGGRETCFDDDWVHKNPLGQTTTLESVVAALERHFASAGGAPARSQTG